MFSLQNKGNYELTVDLPVGMGHGGSLQIELQFIDIREEIERYVSELGHIVKEIEKKAEEHRQFLIQAEKWNQEQMNGDKDAE